MNIDSLRCYSSEHEKMTDLRWFPNFLANELPLVCLIFFDGFAQRYALGVRCC